METTKIQPALTVEEWEHFRIDRAQLSIEKFRDLFEGRPTRNMAVRIKNADVQLVESDECHALAALALYSQPFGFTRADVAMLRRVTRFHTVDVEITEADGTVRRYEALSHLADRIEALLPPE